LNEIVNMIDFDPLKRPTIYQLVFMLEGLFPDS
jgi:hypothetical protein